MIIVNILLSMLTLWGCNSEKEMIDFYKKHDKDLIQVQKICKELQIEYKFESAVIRGGKEDMGFSMNIERPFKSIGYGFSNEDLSEMWFYPCDSCTTEERKKYEALRADSTLKTILRLYTKIKPDAIEITSEGVFFALGAPLKHPNKSEVEGGIFMPFGEDFNRKLVVRKIDDNAYLYDTVVQ